MPGRIERASADDLLQLASDTRRAPMQVAAVLVLGRGTALDLSAVRSAIAERISAVPRLRQRLLRPPPGCGRPVWVDDPRFDIRRHVRHLPCPAPGDTEALLAVAAEAATARLSRTRPLWSATLVTDLADGRAALIVVFHHVLADGIGGLAVLAQLVDGASTSADSRFPRQAPSNGDLLRDALLGRLRAVAALPSNLRRLRGAFSELSAAGTTRRQRSSLNQPTGPRRRLTVAHAELGAVRELAHAHGGTVNDVLLTAVAGALGAVLRHRGEFVDTVVISVPVSARRAATATDLGNEVGVIPMAIPTTPDPLERLTRTIGITRNRRQAPRAASAALLAPAFRVLARLGLFRLFVDHQRLVTTFLTNLRGPDSALSFLGAPITDVIPVGTTTGNVTVSFGALSYAGKLTITVIADPDHFPDLSTLQRELQRELAPPGPLRDVAGRTSAP